MKTLQVRAIRDTAARQRKKCLRKFLYYFPGGYQGKKYQSWERDYKWNAHLLWQEQLNRGEFSRLVKEKNFSEIARRATYIESRTNLLFSFEKMALRDAVKPEHGAEAFSIGLFDLVYGKKQLEKKFDEFRQVLDGLPRKQTRVLTWPLLTVFGFLADPENHIFLKPRVTQTAAEKYGFDFRYRSRPNWETYQNLLDFAETVRRDTAHLKPRDMIDLQSFIWVTGSDEYPD